jgi:two-component system, NarL family, invasion response regulator UvrY
MKILVVDDHAIVRAGLRRLLGPELGAEIVEAATGKEALQLIREHSPDLVILDLNLPGIGGLELIRRFRAEAPLAPILVFSMHADTIFTTRAMETGAAGYLSKNAAPGEILEAVHRLLGGGRYIERSIAQQVALGALAGSPNPLHGLSRRDLEILRLLGEGRGLAQIADAIGVSYKTIANTCGQIKAKLGVARTADLIRIAVETGIAGDGASAPSAEAAG